jgi:hypothetical protein
MIFYGIGLAAKYKWNFKRVRLWIIQPRIKGYDGPAFWEIPTAELRRYVPLFQAAVKRVEENPDEFVEGGWCHWCKAKSICPLKTTKRFEKAIEIFKLNKPKGASNGKEKSRQESDEKEVVFKSEADWKKEAREKARRKKGSVQGRQQEKSVKASDEEIEDFF